jgi:hypothetical protein
MQRKSITDAQAMDGVNHCLRRVERFWMDQIRYIY